MSECAEPDGKTGAPAAAVGAFSTLQRSTLNELAALDKRNSSLKDTSSSFPRTVMQGSYSVTPSSPASSILSPAHRRLLRPSRCTFSRFFSFVILPNLFCYHHGSPATARLERESAIPAPHTSCAFDIGL